MTSPSSTDSLVGRWVCDRYRVLHKVGEGGMGDVYAAEDVVRDRVVALKVMRRDTADPATPERFLREAETLARVKSRNVVRIFDFDRDMARGILFVAMELATGDDLSRLLWHGRLTPALTLRVLQETANGLIAAHAEDIVHRDLKPSNLKLKPKSDGSVRVKILDFGLVRDKKSSASLTGLGKAPGTLTYMPPETLRERPIDSRGDLYSLGVIAYEMLAGLPPFTGRTPTEVATKHLREEPQPIGSLVPEELPESLVDLVHGLLNKDPDSRPQTAADVLATVDQIMADGGHDPRVGHLGASRDPFVEWALLPHI